MILKSSSVRTLANKCSSILEDYYPIVIIGGGIIGKSLALSLDSLFSLNNSKKSICLIDNLPRNSSSNFYKNYEKQSSLNTYSNRVSFLTPSSIRLFKDLQVWRSVVNSHAHPVHGLKIIDCDIDPNLKLSSFLLSKSFLSTVDFSITDVDRSELGYIVQNSCLEYHLNEKLQNSNSIQWFDESQLISLVSSNSFEDYSSSCKEIVFSQKKSNVENKLKASLLIGADGSQSKLRELLGVDYFSYDYDQMGIVATLKIDNTFDHHILKNNIAWQRFLSTGPIALLPLSDSHMSLVWSVPKSFGSLLTKDLSEEAFVMAVNLAISGDFIDLMRFLNNPSLNEDDHSLKDNNISEFRNGFFNKDNPQNMPRICFCEPKSRASFPLRMGIAPMSVSSLSVLVGDAAHSVHPLAGQGLNMGLADVFALKNEIEKALSTGDSPGNVFVLENYARCRDKHNIFMVQMLDLIFRVFTSRSKTWDFEKNFKIDKIYDDLKMRNSQPSPLDTIRRMAMSYLNEWAFGKKLMMKIAMGPYAK